MKKKKNQKKNLLVEIGCEELPVFHQELILEKYANIDDYGFSKLGHGRHSVYTTPRRIVFYIEDLAEKTNIYKERVFGPPKNVAFDKDGKLTGAAEGFARAQGVKAEDLKVERNESRGGGEYLCVEKTSGGIETRTYLKELLPALIKGVSAVFEKTMRWPQEKELSFSRPARWVLALYGKDIMKFRVFSLDSSDKTFGNRLVANRKIEIAEADIEVFKKTLAKAYVMLDQEEREESIMLLTRRALECEHAESADRAYRELVAEVAGLVEWPRAVTGAFPKEYLALPPELVKTCMIGHERFFPIEKDGKLEPGFISVLNNPLKSAEKAIRKGNESVLIARLSDAKYFYEQDVKEGLETKLEKLKNITFQGTMGSVFDKSLRLEALSSSIADSLGLGNEEKGRTCRAAVLSKIDIGSRVVSEFPSLQGVMGRIYAIYNKEDVGVGAAIEEQYSSGSDLGTAGSVIGIANRTDNICAFFAQGFKATGSEDPYGARRDAQGLLEVLMKTAGVKNIPLNELINKEMELLKDKTTNENAKNEITAFLRQRIATFFKKYGVEYDEADAVMEIAFSANLRTAVERAKVIQQHRERPDFKKFITAFKRVVNILQQAGVKNSGQWPVASIQQELLKEEQEKTLYDAYLKIKDGVEKQIRDGNFKEAMETMLVNLARPVDNMFDHVKVMAEDENLRANRLALLRSIADLFFLIADFSKIVLSDVQASKK